MRKLLTLLLLLVSFWANAQVADVYTTRQVPATGASKNNQSNHFANTRFDQNLGLPRHPSNGLYGAKDTAGYVYWNTSVNKIIVYRGGGAYDTLNNNSGTIITQSQVLHLADSLLSKANLVDLSNYVPYVGATGNVNLGVNELTGLNLNATNSISSTNIVSASNNHVLLGDFGSTIIISEAGGAPTTWQVFVNPTNIVMGFYGQTGTQYGLYFDATTGGVSYNFGQFSSYNWLSITPTASYILGNRILTYTNSTLPAYSSGTFLYTVYNSTNNQFETVANAAPNAVTTNSTQTGLTGDKSSSGIWNTSGQWQANGGVTPDGMGAINVTMNSASPYAYYGMTRSGIVAMAFGIDNTNNLIFGTGPTRGNGATIDTVRMKINSHTGDATFYGNMAMPGNLMSANYYATSATPSIVASTGAGTSPTVTITGNNLDQIITVVTGSTPAANAKLVTVTMSGGFQYPNICIPVGANNNSNNTTKTWFFTDETNNSYELWIGATALAASTTYSWTVHNGGN